MASLLDRLRTPCGMTTGHGECCAVGWLCNSCSEKAEAATLLELSYAQHAVAIGYRDKLNIALEHALKLIDAQWTEIHRLSALSGTSTILGIQIAKRNFDKAMEELLGKNVKGALEEK